MIHIHLPTRLFDSTRLSVYSTDEKKGFFLYCEIFYETFLFVHTVVEKNLEGTICKEKNTHPNKTKGNFFLSSLIELDEENYENGTIVLLFVVNSIKFFLKFYILPVPYTHWVKHVLDQSSSRT